MIPAVSATDRQIGKQVEADILRLHRVEKWPVGTIATQLGVHHDTVERIVGHDGLAPERVNPRPSMVDPFVGFITETLKKYPTLRASRLHQMARERGYRGGPDHFRHLVARYRPRPIAEAFLRLRTLIGEQAQADWGAFGKLQIGQALRCLWAFVMVLSWSRQIFLRFYLSAAMPAFVRGHGDAFAFFRGVPRIIRYDSLKSAVLERIAHAIHFNPRILELSAHYQFEPRPVNKARGNQKGRVEHAIRHIREGFLPARSFRDIDDLNQQAFAWMTGVSADRPSREDRTKTVRDAFAEDSPSFCRLRTSRSRRTKSPRSRSATHPTLASISTTTRSPIRWCAAPSRRRRRSRLCALWTGPKP